MPDPQPTLSTSCASGAAVGSPVPRLWTPPLRELTPDTSYGYDLIDFAQVIDLPFDPWQQWAAIHGGELLPDGRPRFRVLLILVARQNGKTRLAKVWTLYWLFIERVPMVLGTSTSRDYAKASWREVVAMAEGHPLLAAELAPKHLTLSIGDESFFTAAECEHRPGQPAQHPTYRFAASNRRAGRSLTVHRAVLDELREHRTWDAWGAATNAMNAVPDGQVVCITNQGDAGSVVLDSLRNNALAYIETGAGDPRLGLLEWSAPNGANPTDPAALAMANPDLGNRIQLDSLLGAALRAVRAGGEELATFKTETMCQRVTSMAHAYDMDAWRACGTDTPIDLARHRDRLVVCFDVALDQTHATLVAAATLDGLTTVEAVKAWHGPGCTRALRAELPDLVEKLRPRAIGWFPVGPAAAIAAAIPAKAGRRSWVPRRTAISPLTVDIPAVCMGLDEVINAGELRHAGDELLTAHLEAAQPLRRGDTWVLTRRGGDPIDGAYAIAGAVHLARTLPPTPPPLTVA